MAKKEYVSPANLRRYHEKMDALKVSEAPNDGNQYVRKNGGWESITDALDTLSGNVKLLKERSEDLLTLCEILKDKVFKLESYNQVKVLTSAEYQNLIDTNTISDNVVYITEDDETAATTLDLPNSEFAIPMPNFQFGKIDDTTVINNNTEEL